MSKLFFLPSEKKWSTFKGQTGSIAQSVARLSPDSRGRKFESQSRRITFVQIDQEIIITVILLHPLIYEGQLLVTGESMSIRTGKPLRGLIKPVMKMCEYVN